MAVPGRLLLNASEASERRRPHCDRKPRALQDKEWRYPTLLIGCGGRLLGHNAPPTLWLSCGYFRSLWLILAHFSHSTRNPEGHGTPGFLSLRWWTILDLNQ
jgi:hypothetical protein